MFPSCYWSLKNTHCLSQDWIYEGCVDVKGKGSADGPRSTNNKATLAVDAAPVLSCPMPHLSHPVSQCHLLRALSLVRHLSCTVSHVFTPRLWCPVSCALVSSSFFLSFPSLTIRLGL